jgi:hypothetical protein
MPGMSQDRLAAFRQSDSGSLSLEQGKAKFILKSTDPRAYSRCVHSVRLRNSRNTA